MNAPRSEDTPVIEPRGHISAEQATAVRIKEIETKAEFDQRAQEAGYLGRFFGFGKSAGVNIAGLMLGVLLLLGALVTFFPPTGVKPLDFWAVISSLITLFAGFIFGKKS